MLSDTWTVVRSALSRKHGDRDQARAMALIGARLDKVRSAALAGTQGGDVEAQRRDTENFLAGYLYCLQQERPELAQIAASIPAYVSSGGQGNAVAAGKGPAVVVHGDVGTSLAITDMSGDINIGKA